MDANDDSDDDALDDVTCWVCFAVFDDPVTLPCAHSFCRHCAQGVLGRAALCPFCRAPFGPPLPGPSPALQLRLQQLSEARGPTPPPPALRGMHRDEWLVVLGHAARHEGVKPLCRVARTCSTLRRFSGNCAAASLVRVDGAWP